MYTHHYLYKSHAAHTKLYITVNIIFKKRIFIKLNKTYLSLWLCELMINKYNFPRVR